MSSEDMSSRAARRAGQNRWSPTGGKTVVPGVALRKHTPQVACWVPEPGLGI